MTICPITIFMYYLERTSKFRVDRWTVCLLWWRFLNYVHLIPRYDTYFHALHTIQLKSLLDLWHYYYIYAANPKIGKPRICCESLTRVALSKMNRRFIFCSKNVDTYWLDHSNHTYTYITYVSLVTDYYESCLQCRVNRVSIHTV